MRNVWIILRKELRSYFVSPVAYLLLAMFAIIFGFFFWNALGYFVYMGMQSQMRGQNFPMNVNEELIRPLLANISVVGLFLIPMITMRLFAEEKRTGTYEFLLTAPIRTGEIVAVDAPGRDPIVTRIIWLRGREAQNANAFARDIYIHGTPEERNIGHPASYGCIRMRSTDIINLYDMVGLGAHVTIVNLPLDALVPELRPKQALVIR